jgi:hypothetical protein
MSHPVSQRLIVTFTVDNERDASLNAWYNTEHIAPRIGMTKGSGFRNCDRYFVSNGAAHYLNVYDLDDGALDSQEYADIRKAEAAMADVDYHTSHFKQAHAPQFRRLVLDRADDIVGGPSADAVVLDVVRGHAFADLPAWTRATLRAVLAASPLVTASSVWSLRDDPGFVLTTDLRLDGVFDWRPVYGGALSWLPAHTTEGIDAEVIVGHRIARFTRPEAEAAHA